MLSLKNSPVFKPFEDAELQPLFTRIKRLSIPANGVLFRQGEKAAHLYLVDTGTICLFLTDHSGREKVIELIADGELFAEAVALMDQPYPVNARATRDSQVYAIPAEDFREFILATPARALRVVAELSKRLHQFINDIHTLTQASARQKVAGYLLALADKTGHESTFELPASKSLLASRLGLQPETFSRIWRHLKEEKIIEENHTAITLRKPQALEQMLGMN